MKNDGGAVDGDMVNNDTQHVEAEGEGSSVCGRGKTIRRGGVQCKLPLSRISGFMGAPRVMCLFCDRSFLSAVLLQKHTNRCHRVLPARRTSARNNDQISSTTIHNYHPGCNFCNSKAIAVQKADDLPALFHHLLDRHSLKYFGCRPCEQRFSNSNQLKSHNQTIHPELLETSSINNSENDTNDVIKCTPVQLPASETNKEKGTSISFRNNYESFETDLLNLNSKVLTKRVSVSTPSKSSTPVVVLSENKKELRSRKNSSKTRSAKTLSKEISAIPPDTRQHLIKNVDVKNINSTELKKLQDAIVLIPPPPRDGFKSPKKTVSEKDGMSESIDKKLSKMGRASVTLTPVQIKPVSNSDTQMLSRLGLAQNRSSRAQSLRRNRKAPSAETRSSSEVSRRDKSKGKNDSEFIINKNRNDPSAKFDPDFYSTVSNNVRENLLKHLDGKLEKSDVACDVPDMINPKIKSTHAMLGGQLPKQPAEIHGSDVALNAITIFPTLLAPDQYGSDKVPHYSYGATTQGFKKTITKNSWKWKWDITKKLKQIHDVGKRDLSRLDIWTQLAMRKKYDKDICKTNPDTEDSDVDVDKAGRQRQINELNDILDRRVFPDIQSELKMSVRNENESIDEVGDVKPNKTDLKQEEVTTEKLDFMAALGLTMKDTSQSAKESTVFSGEWQRPRCYVCCVCGRRADCLRLMEAHQASQHPYAQATYYELVGKEALDNQLYKHLYIPGSKKNIPNVQKKIATKNSPRKTFKPNQSTRILRTTARNIKSQERPCTKCKKTLLPTELHRHILECAGDYGWMMSKKKCKNKPFGARRRRLKGLYKRERPQDDGDKSGKDVTPRPKMPPRPRSKPSDVETIQRMLANLPAKRASKQVLDIPLPKVRKVLNKNHMLRRILPDLKLKRSKTTVVRTIKDGASGKLRRVTRSITSTDPIANKGSKNNSTQNNVTNKKVKTNSKSKKDERKLEHSVAEVREPSNVVREPSIEKQLSLYKKKRRRNIIKEPSTTSSTKSITKDSESVTEPPLKDDASYLAEESNNDNDNINRQPRSLRRRPETSNSTKVIRKRTRKIDHAIIEKCADSNSENTQDNSNPLLPTNKKETKKQPKVNNLITQAKSNLMGIKRKSKKVLGLPLKWIGKRGRVSKMKKKKTNNNGVAIEDASNVNNTITNNDHDQETTTPLISNEPITDVPSSNEQEPNPLGEELLGKVESENKMADEKCINLPTSSCSENLENNIPSMSLSSDPRHGNLGFSNFGNQSHNTNSQNQGQYHHFYDSSVQGASVSNIGSKTAPLNYNQTLGYHLPSSLQILSHSKHDKAFEGTSNMNTADEFAMDNIDKPPLFSTVRAQSQMKEIIHHDIPPSYMTPTLAMQKAYMQTNYEMAHSHSNKSKLSNKSKRGLNDCIAMLRGKLTAKNTSDVGGPMIGNMPMIEEPGQDDESLQPLDLSGRCQAEDLSFNRQNEGPENLTVPKTYNATEDWQEAQDLSMKSAPKTVPSKSTLLSVRKPVYDPTLRIPQFSVPNEQPAPKQSTSSGDQSSYLVNSNLSTVNKNALFTPKVIPSAQPAIDLPSNISHELSLLPQALVNTLEKLPHFQQEEIVKVLPQVLVKAVESYNLLRTESSKRQNDQDILKNISSLTTPLELTHSESPATREEHIRPKPTTIPQTSEISTQTSVPTKEEEIQKCPQEYVNVNTDLYSIDPISGMVSERKIDKLPNKIAESLNVIPTKTRAPHEIIDLTEEATVKEPEEEIPAAIIEKPKLPDSNVRSVVIVDPASLDKNKLERSKHIKGTASLRAVRIKSTSEKLKIKNLALSDKLETLPAPVTNPTQFVPQEIKETAPKPVEDIVVNEKEEVVNLQLCTENTITSSKDTNIDNSDLNTLESAEPAIQQDEVSSTQHSSVEEGSDISTDVLVNNGMSPLRQKLTDMQMRSKIALAGMQLDELTLTDTVVSQKQMDNISNETAPDPEVIKTTSVESVTKPDKQKPNVRKKRISKASKDKKTTETSESSKLKENSREKESKETNSVVDKRDKCEPKSNDSDSDKKTSFSNLLKECNTLSESALTPSNVIDFHNERKALDKCENIQMSEPIQDDADADRSVSVRRSLRSKKTILKETRESVEKDTNLFENRDHNNDIEPIPDVPGAIIPEDSYKANLGNTTERIDKVVEKTICNKEESDDDDICLAAFSKKNTSKITTVDIPTIARDTVDSEKVSKLLNEETTKVMPQPKKVSKKKVVHKTKKRPCRVKKHLEVIEDKLISEPLVNYVAQSEKSDSVPLIPCTSKEDLLPTSLECEISEDVSSSKITSVDSVSGLSESKKELTRKSGRLKSQKESFASIDSVKLSENGHLIFKMHKEPKETVESIESNDKSSAVAVINTALISPSVQEILPVVQEDALKPITKHKKLRKSKIVSSILEDATLSKTSELPISDVDHLDLPTNSSELQVLDTSNKDLPKVVSDKVETSNKKRAEKRTKEKISAPLVADATEGDLPEVVSDKVETSNKKRAEKRTKEKISAPLVADATEEDLPEVVSDKVGTSNKKRAEKRTKEKISAPLVADATEEDLPEVVSDKVETLNKRRAEKRTKEKIPAPLVADATEEDLPEVVFDKVEISNKKRADKRTKEKIPAPLVADATEEDLPEVVFDKVEISSKRGAEKRIKEKIPAPLVTDATEEDLPEVVFDKVEISNKKRADKEKTPAPLVADATEEDLPEVVSDKVETSSKRRAEKRTKEKIPAPLVTDATEEDLPEVVFDKVETSNKKRAEKRTKGKIPAPLVADETKEDLPEVVFDKVETSNKKRAEKRMKEKILAPFVADATEDENDQPLIAFKKDLINKKLDTNIKSIPNKRIKAPSGLCSLSIPSDQSVKNNDSVIKPAETLISDATENSDASNSSDEDIALCKLLPKKKLKKIKSRSSPRGLDLLKESLPVATNNIPQVVHTNEHETSDNADKPIDMETPEMRKNSTRIKNLKKRINPPDIDATSDVSQSVIKGTNDPNSLLGEVLQTTTEDSLEHKSKSVIERRNSRKVKVDISHKELESKEKMSGRKSLDDSESKAEVHDMTKDIISNPFSFEDSVDASLLPVEKVLAQRKVKKSHPEKELIINRVKTKAACKSDAEQIQKETLPVERVLSPRRSAKKSLPDKEIIKCSELSESEAALSQTKSKDTICETGEILDSLTLSEPTISPRRSGKKAFLDREGSSENKDKTIKTKSTLKDDQVGISKAPTLSEVTTSSRKNLKKTLVEKEVPVENKEKTKSDAKTKSSPKDEFVETPKLTCEIVLSPRRAAKKSSERGAHTEVIDKPSDLKTKGSMKEDSVESVKPNNVVDPVLSPRRTKRSAPEPESQSNENPNSELKTKATLKEDSGESPKETVVPNKITTPKKSKKKSILERESLLHSKELSEDNCDQKNTLDEVATTSERVLSPRRAKKKTILESEILADQVDTIKKNVEEIPKAVRIPEEILPPRRSSKKIMPVTELLDESLDKADDEPLSKSLRKPRNVCRNDLEEGQNLSSILVSDENDGKTIRRKSSRTISIKETPVSDKQIKETSVGDKQISSETEIPIEVDKMAEENSGNKSLSNNLSNIEPDVKSKTRTSARSLSRSKPDPPPDDVVTSTPKSDRSPKNKKSSAISEDVCDALEKSSNSLLPNVESKKKDLTPILIDTTPIKKDKSDKKSKKNLKTVFNTISSDLRGTKKCLVSLDELDMDKVKQDLRETPAVNVCEETATTATSEPEFKSSELKETQPSIAPSVNIDKKPEKIDTKMKKLENKKVVTPTPLSNPDIIESSDDLNCNVSVSQSEKLMKRKSRLDSPRKPTSRKQHIVHVDVHVPKEDSSADLPLKPTVIQQLQSSCESVNKMKKHKKKSKPDYNAIDDDLSSEEPLLSIVKAAGKRLDDINAKLSEEEISDKTDSSTCLANLVAPQRKTKKKKAKASEKLNVNSVRKLKRSVDPGNKIENSLDDSLSDSDSLIKLKSDKLKTGVKRKRKSSEASHKVKQIAENVNIISTTTDKEIRKENIHIDVAPIQKDSTESNVLPIDPESIQDKYLADFGMYTEKRPRKSTLLAMKKISKTFKPDGDDNSDDNQSDGESKNKKSVNKKVKNVTPDIVVDNKKIHTPIPPIAKTPELLSSKSDALPDAVATDEPQEKIEETSNIIDDPKIKELPATEDVIKKPQKTSENYCALCKRKFRRHENLLKHQMTLIHISRVSEVEAKEMKSKTVDDEKTTSSSITQNIDQSKSSPPQSTSRVYKNLAERKSFDNKVDVCAERIGAPLEREEEKHELLAIKDTPNPVIEIPTDTSRKTLSTDEALFFECCSLLKESNDIPLAKTVESGSNSYPLASEQNNSSSDSAPYISGVKNILKASELVPPSLTGESDNTMELSQTDSNSEVLNSPPDKRMFAFANKNKSPMGNEEEDGENRFKHFLTNDNLYNVSKKTEMTPLSCSESEGNDAVKKCSGEYDPYSAESLMVRTNSDDFSDNGDSMISSQDIHNTATSKNQTTATSNKSTCDILIFEDKFDKIKRKAREKAQAAKEAMAAVIAPPRSHSKKSSKKSSSKSRKLSGDKKNSQQCLSKSQKSKNKSKKKNAMPMVSDKGNSKKVLTKAALKGFDSVKVSISSEEINFQDVLDKSSPPPYQLAKDKKLESKDFDDSHEKVTITETSTKSYDMPKKSLTSFGKSSLKEKQKPLLNFDSKVGSPVVNDKHDIYEFMDDEDDNMSDSFKFRTPTAINKAGSSKKGELPLSNSISCTKSSLDVQNDDSQISSLSFSDRDDFTYISDDYNANESEDETNHSSNSLEGSTILSKSSKKHKKSTKHRNIKKNAIMGKIFKNNAIRNNDQSPSANDGTENADDVAPGHKDMDQLFDSLFEQVLPESSQATESENKASADVTDTDDVYSAGDEVRADEKAESNVRSPSACESDSDNDDDPNPIPAYPRTSQRKIVPRLKARSSDDESMQPKPQQQHGKKSEIGVASHKSQRKCTTGKQNVLVESWSSESDYEDFRQFEEYSSIPRSQKHHRRPRRSGRHRQADQSRIEQTETSDVNLNTLENQLCGDEGNKSMDSENVESTEPDTKQDHDDPNMPGRRVTFTPNIVFKNKSSKRKRRQSQKPFDYDDEFKPTRIAEPLTTQRRIKRAASEMLYYWSSSSDDDMKNASTDVSGRESEPVEQHGWIVGDSHKKLVTMLAHAKGRKVDDTSSVKEKKSRPSS